MPTSQYLTKLILNVVESQEVYDYMEAKGLINSNELYLVNGDEGYTLPTASATILGGIKVGSKLAIAEDGTLSVDISDATTSESGLMAATDKSKLDGIATGANKYTHPSYTVRSSGLYKITVDSTGHVSSVTAVSKDDITALGIPGQDTNTTYDNATQSAAGLMSSTDKKKLDGIASGANNYTHPSYTQRSSGLYKITVDAQGHISNVSAVTKEDITALGIPAQDTNTTYSAATQTLEGLMSAEDKKKLDGLEQIEAITTAEIDAAFD